MFPTLHFLVYDGNPIKLDKVRTKLVACNPSFWAEACTTKKQVVEHSGLPSNVRVKTSWFSEAEAKRCAATMANSPRAQVLLIADTNNLDWDKANPGPVVKVSEQQLHPCLHGMD